MKTLSNYIEKSILENKAENDDPLAKTYPNDEWDDDIDLKEKINAILDKLKKNDSLADSISIANAYRVEGEGTQANIIIDFKFGPKGEKVINGLKRISKPGLRIYASAEELPSVINGLGIAIISTNKGLMTDRQARELKLGGEVLAFVW